MNDEVKLINDPLLTYLPWVISSNTLESNYHVTVLDKIPAGVAKKKTSINWVQNDPNIFPPLPLFIE